MIKQLLEKFPETKAGKTLADKMIDINGPPPEGFGLQNLRKSIIQMKYKYDASTEDKQTGELCSYCLCSDWLIFWQFGRL